MINILVPILSSLAVLAGEVTVNVDEYVNIAEEIICESWEDCKVMSEAIVYESRGESERGQKAVADVIMCRYKDSRWPDTIAGVVYQRSQFSYVIDMHKQRLPSKNDFQKARHISILTLTGQRNIETNACWYHANHVKPSWAKKMKLVATIGNHKFYKDW